MLSVAFTAASLMGAKVEAQTTGTADNSDGSAIKGVDKLAGSVPANLKVTDESQYTNNDPAHVFFLYNVGLKKFVGNGGSRTMKGIYNLARRAPARRLVYTRSAQRTVYRERKNNHDKIIRIYG